MWFSTVNRGMEMELLLRELNIKAFCDARMSRFFFHANNKQHIPWTEIKIFLNIFIFSNIL